MILEYVCEKEIDIKNFLLEKKLSKRIVSNLLLEKKNVYINGKVYSKQYVLMPKDKVKVEILDDNSNILTIDKKIDIVFEDECFLVVKKEKGLATIPTKAHYEDNLSSRVLNYYKKNNINAGVHILNRLDLLTSGLVVFCKSKVIHQQVSSVNIEKKYCCLIEGILKNKQGEINEKIDRIGNSIKREVNKNGKTAITKYKVINDNNGKSKVDISLLTGRTHQIRVHFSYIGHPLIGDTLYNNNAINDSEFYLNCYKIAFHFPFNNKNYNFEIEK